MVRRSFSVNSIYFFLYSSFFQKKRSKKRGTTFSNDSSKFQHLSRRTQMSDLQTGKKEDPTPDSQENTNTSADCQGNTLVACNAIFENMNHFVIYDHCIKYVPRKKEHSYREKKRTPRGKIQGFSKRSRFRLFTLLSMVRNDIDFKPLFVTLT